MKIFVSLVIANCLSYFVSNAQVISGSAKDTFNVGIPSVSITLHKKGQSQVISFSITDKEGRFSIKFSISGKDTLELKASTLGYAQQSIFFIINKLPDFSFKLIPVLISLPEVIVKTPPVWLRKDTINYDALMFKQPQDRVIGDIISRLPGIEVTAAGQIKYNGKPINKFYIEGLDLLEDKYGVANNNLSADAVDRVQILENHEPIRVLDSLSFSDRAAINIKLNNNAKIKLLSRARLGAGFEPLITENELSLMMFKKRFQFINIYKHNNVGIDNSKELGAQNINDFVNQIQNGTVKTDILSLIQPSPPPLSQRRYLMNSSHVLSSNFLIPLRNEYQLRINTAYVNDFQKQRSENNIYIYLPNDTVKITEQNRFRGNMNRLHADFTLQANTPTFFLKNILRTQAWKPEEAIESLTNLSPLNQSLSNSFYALSNDFRLIKTKKKKIIEYASYVGYTLLPQQLRIRPGQYEVLLNNGNSYEELVQKANLPTFYTDNNIVIRRTKSKISTQLKTGFNYQQQKLKSNILFKDNGMETSAVDSFRNDLDWKRWCFYSEPSFTVQTPKLRFSLSVPFQLNTINYSNLDTSNKENSFFVLPSSNINYQIGTKSNIVLSYNFNQSFGDIFSVANGFILKNYRYFSRQNVSIQEVTGHATTLSFTFRNPVKIFFFNIGLRYGQDRYKQLYQQKFSGILESISAVLKNNFNKSNSFFGRITKYVLNWSTSLTLNGNYTFGSRQLLQQNIIQKISNRNFSINPSINSKLSEILFLEYNGMYNWFASNSADKKNAIKTYSFTQGFFLNILPSKKWLIRLSAEQYVISNSLSETSLFYFADATFRFKPKKGNIDYELLVSNIFDTKSFTSVSLINNIEAISSYELRPRQALFKVSFPL